MVSLREIPSVDQILQNPNTEQLLGSFGRDWTTQAVREVLNTEREELKTGKPCPSEEVLISMVSHELQSQAQLSLRPVINATGVILHTNLGRAPLSEDALAQIQAVGATYSTLEFDLASGKRGKRDVHAADQLIRLTGAEAALIVNNNAGAVLLVLSALAKGKKVAISRSQLVEIGGGFRIPDVMKQSGAKLLEVGTTNRTNRADFETAIAEGAKMLLWAHQSNFQIVGFSSSPEIAELGNLAHQHCLPLMVDLGSGAVVDTTRYSLRHEPTAMEVLAAGVDVVCFSGDKLLGGPQAGIILGRADLLEKIRKHPLYRALRADKLCLAGLNATLLHYLKGEAEEKIPLIRMLALKPEEIKTRVEAWIAELGFGSRVKGRSTIGGGSLPGQDLPTYLLALRCKSIPRATAALRQQNPPIIARVQEDLLLLDPRTILPWQEKDLLKGLKSIENHIEVQE